MHKEIKVTDYLIQRLSAAYEIDHETGCHNYTGSKSKKGYGIIGASGKKVRAHRAAYTCFVGPIPEGLFVLHSCDNPSCINPKHLRVGTNKDNIADKVKRGRAQRSHCKCGRLYTREPSGRKVCKSCRQQRHRARYVPVVKAKSTVCGICGDALPQERLGKKRCMKCVRELSRENHLKRSKTGIRRGAKGDYCNKCGSKYEIKSLVTGRRFCRKCANARRKVLRNNNP